MCPRAVDQDNETRQRKSRDVSDTTSCLDDRVRYTAFKGRDRAYENTHLLNNCSAADHWGV